MTLYLFHTIMTQLLWEELTFGNTNQMLICKRLDADYKNFAKIKYLRECCRSPEQIELIKQYDELEWEKTWKDKYNKSLIDIKLKYIIDDLVAPIMNARREYYEKFFKYALEEKRSELRQKMQKKYKNRNIVLPF